MDLQRFSSRAIGVFLVLISFASVVNLLRANSLLALNMTKGEREEVAVTWEETAVSTISLESLTPESQIYLETEFCRGGLCPPGGWQQWIIVDEARGWTVPQLQLLHQALSDTFGALAELGIDGRQLLAGYRFRYQPGDSVINREAAIALIHHEHQEIILTDKAFSVQAGFSIYHELGHAVDHRLQRQLTTGFIEIIGAGEDHRHETGHLIPDSHTVRTETRHSPYEAAADAFGVWVFVRYLQTAEPVFSNAPPEASYRDISDAVNIALRLAVTEQGANRLSSANIHRREEPRPIIE